MSEYATDCRKMKILTKLMQGLLRVFSALPLGFHYAWAGFFAWLLRDVMHYRRDVVMINLSRAFPDKKYKELKQREFNTFLYN